MSIPDGCCLPLQSVTDFLHWLGFVGEVSQPADVETAVLPGDRHRKNDVARVTVDADDGENQTSQDATVTISDTPPKVALSGIPSAVVYGERVEFDAIVSDVDGDADGYHEIFLLYAASWGDEDTLVRLDGVGRRQSQSAMVPAIAGSSANIEIADLNGDGSLELIYMTPAPDSRSSIVVLSAKDLTVLWQSPWLFGSINRNSVHYAEIGGEPRLAIGTTEAMYLTR